VAQKSFSEFMKTVAAKYVDRGVHMAVSNLGTRFATEVHDRLAENPTIAFIACWSERHGSIDRDLVQIDGV
jgi:hypothetical protein